MLNETEEKNQKIIKYQPLRLRRNWIVYRLKMSGYTVSDLARKLGVVPQAVTNALRISYPRIEKAIARILCEPVQVLFPERYDSEGRSLRRRGRPLKNKDTTATEKIKAKDSGEFSNLKTGGGD